MGKDMAKESRESYGSAGSAATSGGPCSISRRCLATLEAGVLGSAMAAIAILKTSGVILRGRPPRRPRAGAGQNLQTNAPLTQRIDNIDEVFEVSA